MGMIDRERSGKTILFFIAIMLFIIAVIISIPAIFLSAVENELPQNIDTTTHETSQNIDTTTYEAHVVHLETRGSSKYSNKFEELRNVSDEVSKKREKLVDELHQKNCNRCFTTIRGNYRVEDSNINMWLCTYKRELRLKYGVKIPSDKEIFQKAYELHRDICDECYYEIDGKNGKELKLIVDNELDCNHLKHIHKCRMWEYGYNTLDEY